MLTEVLAVPYLIFFSLHNLMGRILLLREQTQAVYVRQL